MAVIEVIPDEIRYWYATRTKVGQVVDIAVSAVSGKTAAPGELRTITKDEVSLCYVFVRQGSRRTSVATDPACAGLDNKVRRVDVADCTIRWRNETLSNHAMCMVL